MDVSPVSSKAPVEPLVFPVGHYLGSFFSDVGAPRESVRLRVGPYIAVLATDVEVAIWALAHGLPDELAEHEWTRAKMMRIGERDIGAEFEAVFAGLLRAGMLVEIEPGSAESVEFAHLWRFRSLLVGLGTDAQRPDEVGIGIPRQAAVFVDKAVYEIWQTAPLASSLWEASVLLALTGQEPFCGADPAEVLSHVLRRLHVLLANGAGYLDLSDAASEPEVAEQATAADANQPSADDDLVGARD